MVQISLAEMFSSLGWGSGFKLPVSSESNKQLEKILEEKQRYALQLSSELEDNSQRVDMMKNHIDRVTEQIEYDQKVFAAKKSELDTEKHMQALTAREFSKVKSDCKQSCQQTKEILNRNTIGNGELFKRQRALDELVGIVEFDRKALERYKESIEEKENYITYVEQFADMDSRTIDECKKKHHKLTNVNSEATNELEENFRVTTALQKQLEHSTGALRRLNKERVEALDLWKSTLTSMKSRDEEMNEIAKEYADVKIATRPIKERLSHKQEMMEAEKCATREAMRLHEKNEKNICLLKETVTSHRNELKHLKEMRNKLKRELKQLDMDTKEGAEKLESLEKELARIDMNARNFEVEINKMKERNQNLVGDTMTSEEQMKELTILLNAENDKMGMVLARMEKERKYLGQRVAQKAELVHKIELLKFGIGTRKSDILSMKDKIQKQDIIIHRTKVLSYEIDLQSFKLRHRYDRMTNPNLSENGEEMLEKQTQVAKLNEENQRLIQQRTFLLQQFKHVTETGGTVLHQIRESVQEHQVLKASAIKCRLLCQKCLSEEKYLNTKMNDETVEYRLIQVQLQRLNAMTKAQRSAIFDMEQNRVLMNAVAKEKLAEIEVHLSLLNGKKRGLDDERSKLRIEFSSIQNAVERLKKKYDIVMYTMDSDRAEGDDEIHSEAYYVLKKAKDREMLRQEGDLWDSRVKEAEQEVIALQNTLSLIFNSNQSFKDSLSPVVENSEEALQIKQLQEQSELALVQEKRSKKVIYQLNQEIKLAQSEINLVSQEIIQGNQECTDKNYELSTMLLDIENQNTKIKRANMMSNKILRELGPQGEHERVLIEADLKYLATKTKLEYTLSTVERFAGMHPSLKTTIVEYLHLKDMKRTAARILNSGKSGLSSASSTPHRSATPSSTGKSTPKQYSTNTGGGKGGVALASRIIEGLQNGMDSGPLKDYQATVRFEDGPVQRMYNAASDEFPLPDDKDDKKREMVATEMIGVMAAQSGLAVNTGHPTKWTTEEETPQERAEAKISRQETTTVDTNPEEERGENVGSMDAGRESSSLIDGENVGEDLDRQLRTIYLASQDPQR